MELFPKKITKMKKIIALVAVVMISAGTIRAQSNSARPEMGKVCSVYSGEGIYVTTCRIGPEKNSEALVGVTGVDHQWNGRLFKAKVIRNNANFDYEIQADGKPYHIFIYRDNGGYSVYLKNYGSGKTEQRVTYDKWESQRCKPEYLLTEYLEQQEKK